MTLQLRRALALFFICLFVLVAPAALAYGRGYRFSIATRTLQQTGVLLLHGQPKNVFVSIDGQQPRNTSLPKTFRSVTPGTHTVRLTEAEYSPQDFTVNVQPGKTSYLINAQLLRSAPFTTLRTALPSTAEFNPTGTMLAWVSAGRVVIATPDGRVESEEIPKLQSIAWNGQTLEAFDQKTSYLGQVTRAGIYSPNVKRTVVSSEKLVTLAQSAGITYTSAQRVDTLGGWLLITAEGGWFLSDDGFTEIITRWSEVPLTARIIGNSVLAIVRQGSITLRNLVTNQSETFALNGIRKISDNPSEGKLDLLVQDGDLRSWIRAEFF